LAGHFIAEGYIELVVEYFRRRGPFTLAVLFIGTGRHRDPRGLARLLNDPTTGNPEFAADVDGGESAKVPRAGDGLDTFNYNHGSSFVNFCYLAIISSLPFPWWTQLLQRSERIPNIRYERIRKP
jgi:hypothetical protein